MQDGTWEIIEQCRHIRDDLSKYIKQADGLELNTVPNWFMYLLHSQSKSQQAKDPE